MVWMTGSFRPLMFSFFCGYESCKIAQYGEEVISPRPEERNEKEDCSESETNHGGSLFESDHCEVLFEILCSRLYDSVKIEPDSHIKKELKF